MPKDSGNKQTNRALLKELIRTSPKKYTAVLLSDSEDDCKKKAILVSDSDSEDNFDENPKHYGRNAKYTTKGALHTTHKKNFPALDFSSDDDSDFDDEDSYVSSTFTESQYSYSTNGSEYSKAESYQSYNSYDSQYSHTESEQSVYSDKKVCPHCSKVLSSDSYLSDEDEEESEFSESEESESDSFLDDSDDSEIAFPTLPKVRSFDPRAELAKMRHEANVQRILYERSKCENIPTPQVIISPRMASPMRLQKLESKSKIDQIIENRKEKLQKEKEAERQRLEEEAVKKAKEEMEKQRKESIKALLESIRQKRQYPDRYVAIYRKPKQIRVSDHDDYDYDYNDSEEYYTEESYYSQY